MKAYKINEEAAEEITEEMVGVNVNKINALSNGITSGVLSIKQAQRILNEDLSDEELEIEYVRTLVEKGIALTQTQADLYNGVVNEDTTNTVVPPNDNPPPQEQEEE